MTDDVMRELESDELLDTLPDETPPHDAMNEPYFAEVDSNGCSHCGEGRTWRVVGPDGMADSVRYDYEPDAERHTERLNAAFSQGVRSTDARIAALTAENERLRGGVDAVQGRYMRLLELLEAAGVEVVLTNVGPEEVRQPEVERLRSAADALVTARPFEEWHEDIGCVLWWHFPIKEPPYLGSPLDSEFLFLDGEWATQPYYTHWTPLPNCNEIQERFDAARSGGRG